MIQIANISLFLSLFKIAQGDYVTSPLATPLPSQEPSIKETTNQQIPTDTDNAIKHAARTPESLAGPAEASPRKTVINITYADSSESDIDIPLDPLTQDDTAQNTMKTDGHFLNRGSISPTNQAAPMQSKYLKNGKEPLALTWVEVPPGNPYQRPRVDDYPDRDEDSRSRSFREYDIHVSRNRYGGSRRPRRLSWGRRRDPSFDSERWWRDKQRGAYYSSIQRRLDGLDPPLLTFYWASQIDIELGCWATPWERGLFSSCIDALGMMVDIGLAGLSQTARWAQPKAKRPAVNSNEILYAEFPGSMILEDLWLHLREGQHTWPPYAINARGGVRGLATHLLVQHPAFRDDERLPQLTLLNSVHMSTARTSMVSQNLERDRILELASIDFWLSQAAATNSISEGKSNLIINTPAIVEEIWLDFCDEIMQTREERWNPSGGDMHVRKLAKSISDFLCDFLGSPAENYFVWVAFLRAVKVMECVANGPRTFPALDMFENDILVYLV